MTKLVVFLCLLLLPVWVFTQERARIEVVHADEWTYDKNKGEDITIIRGNALFKHEAAFVL
ncbi:MAG: hypothetical protein RBR21_11330 [Bacteroidales bacterium]|nr:hypothetical protein [Bacteroidales bacterium]